MEDIKIKDKKNRIIFETQGSRFVIARFVDMDIETKNAMAELYSDLTGKNKEEVFKFLNFESNERAFCS
jgi:hypothetical protein